MTTRPGYVWDSAVSEWVEIGQSAVVAPVAYQASAPSTPATGDIWIDSDDEVPSVDSTLYYRWTKTMSGGETSLSGTDNNSLSLRYTPGYESVFINGVLQARNLDYTATSGSTIAGLTALVANDIVMVESIVAYSVGDTYTQAVSDAKYVNKNVGGLNLVVPTSVTGGSLSTNGQITFSSSSSVSINGCFSSTYQNYKVIISCTTQLTAGGSIFWASRNSGVTDTTSNSYSISGVAQASGTITALNLQNQASAFLGYSAFPSGTWGQISAEFFRPFEATFTGFHSQSIGVNAAGSEANSQSNGMRRTSAAHDGITFTFPYAASGTIRIYGYGDGA
jgi:hypothetical protein